MDILDSISLTIISLISMALTPPVAEAQQVPTCINLYNGGVSCTRSDLFDVEKSVQNPKDGSFVQILEPNDTKIMPGNTMIFRISITNTSEKTLENIKVTDKFSDTLNFANTQKGQFNDTNHELAYTIDSLEAGASETFDLQATIKSQSELPNVTGPLCAINMVTVTHAKESEAANVQFCIEKTASQADQTSQQGTSLPGSNNQIAQSPNMTKGGQTVHTPPNNTKTPDTGPELLGLFGLIPALGAGFYLRKYAK